MGKLPAKNKTTCKGCAKIIRKDHTPITCSTCHSSYHKKCAKLINSITNITNFNCTCSTTPNFTTTPPTSNKHSKLLSAQLLNEKYSNKSYQTMTTSCNNQHANLSYPSFSNVQEEYFDNITKKTLKLENSNLNQFLLVCINMRSLANLLNFSKLEMFLQNLEIHLQII